MVFKILKVKKDRKSGTEMEVKVKEKNYEGKVQENNPEAKKIVWKNSLI